MANNQLRVAIVGGGLAGLAAAMRIAEGGHDIDGACHAAKGFLYLRLREVAA